MKLRNINRQLHLEETFLRFMNWEIQVKSLRRYYFAPVNLTKIQKSDYREEKQLEGVPFGMPILLAEPGLGKLNPASPPHSPTSRHISENPSHRARRDHSGYS